MAAAYALYALDPDEHMLMESHLTECSQCRELVAEIQGVVALLPLTVSPTDPPPYLRDRLMQRIKREGPRTDVTDSVPSPEAAAARRRAGSGLWSFFTGPRMSLAVSTVALIVIVAMSGVLWRQYGQLRELQAQAGQARALDELLASPDVSVATMRQDGIEAKVLSAPGHTAAYVVVNNLPPLPADRDYQIWLRRGEQLVSAAVVHPDRSGRWLLQRDEPLSAYNWIGITNEPRGGSGAPTTEPIMGGDLGT